MYYFIGNNLGTTLTCIEKAQINRMELFNSNNMNARTVFVKYSPKLHQNTKKFGIQNNTFSIYDYFQNSIVVEENHDNWLDYWKDVNGFTAEAVEGTSDIRFYDNDQYVMYVHFSDGDYSQVEYVNYFDESRKKVKRDIFDSRGFLSKSIYLGNNAEPILERFYTPEGACVIEKFYETTNSISYVKKIIVMLADGKVVHLKNDTNLLTLFTACIYEDGDVFFSDKNNVTFEGLAASNSKIPVVAVLHSTHLKYGKSNHIDNVKNIYKPVFSNLDRLSAIVTSTQDQKKDVLQMIDNKVPVFDIPPGYVENSVQLNNKKRSNNKLISIGRFAVEKQHNLQLDLVERLLKDFSNIQLHMFGEGNEKEKLLKEISTRGLEDHVLVRGFKENLTDEIESSALNVMTSRMEGFSLSLLETLAHGVPSVAFDVEYGPGELINNGKNGFLVPLDNVDILYDRVKRILSEPLLRTKLSQGAMISTMRYTSNKTFKKWLKLIENTADDI